MSRHRDIRNMNINDELADDDLSDNYDEEDDMTDGQRDQMATGLAQVRSVLGDEDESGIDDKQIKDALWDSFFDVEGTIAWLLDQRAKQAAVAAKKAPDDAIEPPLSALQRLALQRKQAGVTPTGSGLNKTTGLASLAKGLSRKPLISQPADSKSTSIIPTIVPNTTPTPNETSSPKPSKLSALAQKSAAQRAVMSSTSPVPQIPATQSPPTKGSSLSKLALRIKAQKEAQEAASRPPPPVDLQMQEPNVPVLKPEFKLFQSLRPAETTDAPILDAGANHTRTIKAGPSLFGSILVSKRETEGANGSFTSIYSGILSGTSSSGFQFDTPSPDDAVLAAREGTRLNAYKKGSTVVGSRK